MIENINVKMNEKQKPESEEEIGDRQITLKVINNIKGIWKTIM